MDCHSDTDLSRKTCSKAALSLLIGDNTRQTSFVFAMGYPTISVALSPRRPVTDTLI